MRRLVVAKRRHQMVIVRVNSIANEIAEWRSDEDLKGL